jgi:hypothetical protein
MDISKEQAIKDLGLENSSAEMQDQIVGSFMNGLQAKIQVEMIGRLSDDQKTAFANMNEEEQDKFMAEAVGGDIDAFVDEIYKEAVDEFIQTAEKIAKGMSSDAK